MRIAVNGTRLFVDVAGQSHPVAGDRVAERPVVLVVHGGPGMDHSLLKPAFLPLADRAQVVWVDLRGHGRSDPAPRREWTLGRWAADLLGLIAALGLDRPIVAGASIGGTCAVLAAAREPHRIGGLLLASTPVGPRVEQIAAVFERLGGSPARTAAARYWNGPDRDTDADYRRLCLPLYARDPLPTEVLGRAILRPEIALHLYASAEWRALDVCAAAPAVDCPAVVLSGEDDPVAPHAAAAELAARLPGGRLVSLPGCRHVLFRDAPDQLRAETYAFVDELWTARRAEAA